MFFICSFRERCNRIFMESCKRVRDQAAARVDQPSGQTTAAVPVGAREVDASNP
jgi:hypothetical protein